MDFSIFEISMLVCFGVSWPINIYKSITSKTAKGKSVMFLVIIWIGYICGIAHKFLYSRDIVLILYVFNLVLVSIDFVLTMRNRALDAGKNNVEGDPFVLK